MVPVTRALATCCAVLGYLYSKLQTRRELSHLRRDLGHEQTKRQAERKGRIRAEQQLKSLSQSSARNACQLVSDTVTGVQSKPVELWPMRPIGTITSVFIQRNGTPRQPLLVPAARCRLDLCPHVPSTILEGLEQYTHCWVIYVFHLNTDLHQSQSGKGIKGKVKPPRLNGQATGVLATRTPHRPNPIGLSLCKIVRVGQTELVLGGADIVDGTPVLDVKPYVPFCECLREASAPSWVVDAMDEEPLDVGRVVISDSVAEEMRKAVPHLPRQYVSLMEVDCDVCRLVQQVLSFDLRSLHRRQRDVRGSYHVCVAGLQVEYAVSDGYVNVIGTSMAQ